MGKINLADLGTMNCDELRSAIADLKITLANLHQDENGELRDLNKEETEEFNSTSHLLMRAEQHLTLRETYENKPNAAKRFGGNLVQSPKAAFDKDALRLRDDEARDNALRALELRSKSLGDNQLNEADRLVRSTVTESTPNVDGSYIARRLLLTESDEYRSAFKEVLSNDHPILTQEEVRALRDLRRLDAERSGPMAEGTPSLGGYGVPVTLDPTIMLTAQGSTNAVLQLCRKEVVTSNVWKGVSSAGATWSFDPEGSEVSDDSPTLAQPTVPVYMARGFIPYSIEVGQDYPGFAENIANVLGEGYSDLASEKMLKGSGTNEPTGVQTSLANNTNVQVGLATAGTFAAEDVNAVWEALPERFKPRASWLMGYGTADTAAGFGNSNNLSFVTVNLSQVLNTLRTRPVYNSAWMTDTISTNTPVAIVGDFNNYLFASRAGMSIETIPLLMGVTNHRPTGQRGFFAYARFGSDVVVPNGFRLLINS